MHTFINTILASCRSMAGPRLIGKRKDTGYLRRKRVVFLPVYCRLCTVLMALCVAGALQTVHGQNTEYEDVILLQTAEVLRGQITDSIPAESVTILLKDGTSRTVARNEIAKILREPALPSRKEKTAKEESPPEDTEKLWGYRGRLGLGYGLGVRTTETDYLRFNFIHGAGIGRVFAISVGSGLRISFAEDITAIPLFMDLRFSGNNAKVAPTFAGGFGTLFQKQPEWADNGALWYLEGGIIIRSRGGKQGIMITVGYETFDFSVSRLRAQTVEAFHFNLAFTF